MKVEGGYQGHRKGEWKVIVYRNRFSLGWWKSLEMDGGDGYNYVNGLNATVLYNLMVKMVKIYHSEINKSILRQFFRYLSM